MMRLTHRLALVLTHRPVLGLTQRTVLRLIHRTALKLNPRRAMESTHRSHRTPINHTPSLRLNFRIVLRLNHGTSVRPKQLRPMTTIGIHFGPAMLVLVLDHRSVGRLNASHHRRTLIHNGNFWLGCRVDLREGINNKKKLSTFDG